MHGKTRKIFGIEAVKKSDFQKLIQCKTLPAMYLSKVKITFIKSYISQQIRSACLKGTV